MQLYSDEKEYCIVGNFQRKKFLEILDKTNDFQKYISEYSLFLLYLEMALLKYFILKRHDKMKTSLPDASGPLAITMPSGSIIAANSSVAKVIEKQLKLKSRVVITG